MKKSMYQDHDYLSCRVLILFFLMSNISSNVFCKCTLDKQDVTCFGGTWKQDLLPIENNSLEKLHITKCAESPTRSDTVDINFLRNVSKLTFLSMTNCALIRPPIINYPINSIEIIDLSNNLIDTNTQFPVLGLDFFKRFPNLKVLNLTNNRLTNLPKSWFDCPSKLEIIILDDNLIGGLNPFLASCFVKLKVLSLKRNQFERLRVPSKTKKSSNGVFPKERNGLRIFADQNNMLPRVKPANKVTDDKEGKLSRSRHDYLGVIPLFKSLETLDLSQNSIKSIDQIPLSKLENLIRLNLSYNRLSSNAAKAVNENRCDFGTAPFYTNGQPGLIELELSGNVGLTRIHNCWTFGLQNLQILRISNCSITSIHDTSFEKMKALITLDLSHNKLSNVPKEITHLGKSLTWLSLAYNNISQLTSSHLISLENLRTLNLSHNQYQNLMGYPVMEQDNKGSDSINDFPSNSRDVIPDEPINLLSKMRQLQELDLSFNNFIKVSATTDLSSSIKPHGELQRVDLRGNPLISQFSDFNPNDITTTLADFLINEDLKLHCDCIMLGFIKWINQRHLEVSGKCAMPQAMSHMSLSDPQLLTLILSDNSCKDVSGITSLKPTYRLKLSSNANHSLGNFQSDNDPMDDGQKKLASQKRQVDYQKWIMTGQNLTLRCEFYSTYQTNVPLTIEWQRLKLQALDNSYFSQQDRQQANNLFLKPEKTEPLNNVKYREKIERLSSNYDPRIKTTQIGPIDKDTIIDIVSNSAEQLKSTFTKGRGSTYKYVGFLLLRPIYLSDIGRYRCLVNNLPNVNLYGQNQVISKEENIKVFTPPRFTSTPSNPMAVIEGETAEITCRAVGNPSPMTSLGRIGSRDFPAASGRRMTIYKDDSSFFITNVRQIDAGNYSCTSRNVAGIIYHNFTLKVQMRATILNKIQSEKAIKIGEALIIRFKVDGVPAPTVIWSKDGNMIVENDRISFSSDQLMLVIQSTILTDAGNYKLSVLNAFGGNDASVSVRIIDSQGRSVYGPLPQNKDKSSTTNHDKEPAWMPDYWLSGIFIIVILSIVITSILWLTIFFCFSKVIGSKKRRLLFLSNSQSKGSFDRAPLSGPATANTAINASTTTSFSNPRLMSSSLLKASIPLSLTTSTIVPHDHTAGDYDEHNDDIDTFTDSTKTPSSFYSPQLFHGEYSNNRILSQLYLSRSGMDLSSALHQQQQQQPPPPQNHHSHRTMDPCDSGIDSSQVYSETLNSSDVPLSVYQCRHKTKHHHHRTNQKQRRRYVCDNSSDSSEAMRTMETDGSRKESGEIEEGMRLEIVDNMMEDEQQQQQQYQPHHGTALLGTTIITPLILAAEHCHHTS